MGRGDGRERIVSAPDADDTGAGILHVDMDAFFAAVEVCDDPSLRGQPIIIGSRDPRSVVSSASYPARHYGVRAAMPVGQALRLCPGAIVVPPHFDRYAAKSAEVMAIFAEFSPLVEPLSIDEAFLDVRGARRLWGPPGQIARLLRERVRAETGLTCSVGAAATKHVAKMASTLSKPDGVLIIAEADTARFLAPRPVSALWGVGPKATAALTACGVHTVADVLQTPTPVLERALGQAMAARIWHLARGIDARTVGTERVEKSIGHEETFTTDVADDATLKAELRRLADRVAARLRRGDWEATGVAIKVRFTDFTTVSRSQVFSEPTAVSQRIGQAAVDLFSAVPQSEAVRLLGVRAERLRPAGGAGVALWDEDAAWRQVDEAVDNAAERFGSGVITRAASLRSIAESARRRPPGPPIDQPRR